MAESRSTVVEAAMLGARWMEDELSSLPVKKENVRNSFLGFPCLGWQKTFASLFSPAVIPENGPKKSENLVNESSDPLKSYLLLLSFRHGVGRPSAGAAGEDEKFLQCLAAMHEGQFEKCATQCVWHTARLENLS